MNKKIYVGMLAFGVAASFWACGSGDILEPNAGDGIMKLDMSNQEDPTASDPSVSWDVMTKENCPRCYEGGVAKSSSSRRRPIASSSSLGSSSSAIPVPGYSSSQDGPITIKSSSSSAPNPGPGPSVSSSSRPAVSSSSAVPASSATPGPSSDFGTCAPEKNPVSKGEAVTWVMKAKDPTLLISANSVWTMKGGTPDNGSNKGMNGRTQQTTYNESGDYGASVQVSVGAANYNITCEKLHVNGDPITGCECTTAATSVDFTAAPGGAVTWSVAGCATGAGIGLSYEWDGGAAGAETSYAKAFAAADPGYTPKLVVRSTDNSMLEVTCPTVKVTEGPEYVIKQTGATGVVDLPAGSSSVVLNVPCQNNTVFCRVDRNNPLSSTGALDGKVNDVVIKGSDYIAVKMEPGVLVAGATLNFVLDVPAICGAE